MEEIKKMNFEREFSLRYPDYAYLIPAMERILKKEIEWSDLTKVNLTRVKDGLMSTHSANTVRHLLAMLKAFMNLYSEEVEIPCADYAKVLRVKREPSQQIALTEEELMRINSYEPLTDVEKDIKILAMREALCGARGSDVELITTANVSGGEITYVAKKTKRSATIPAGNLFISYLNMEVKGRYSRATKNKTLKRICRNCGINEELTLFYRGSNRTAPKYEFVGFHTLRRTFASILASKGVPVSTIQQWMTHSSLSQTVNYIKVDIKKENEKYASLFI